MRCPTTHGSFRCSREMSHDGECETESDLGRRGRAIILDKSAAQRIEALEMALRLVKTMFCSSQAEGAACDCCRRMREFAAGVLEGS